MLVNELTRALTDRAPENPFPLGVEDAWAGVVWAFDNLDSFGGRADNVIMGSMSAGANITAVVAQRTRETEGISFRGQILRFPFLVHPKVHPPGLDFSSYEENAEAPILSTHALKMFLEWYNPDPEDLRVSPLLAESFAGLPPTYFQIGGADPLRDDGIAYAENLEAAGVPVKADVYAGLPHAFTGVPLEVSKKSDEDLIKAVK